VGIIQAYSRGGRLLGRALYTLGTWMHIIVIVIHSRHASCAGVLSCRVNVVKCVVFYHGIWWRNNSERGAWWEHGFQRADLLGCQCTAVRTAKFFRELNIELDVEVSEIVVAVRRHTLATDNLDLTWAYALSWDDIDRQPPVVKVLDVDLATGKSGK
jgi:hypothetical protein